jgi:hypothetical protein
MVCEILGCAPLRMLPVGKVITPWEVIFWIWVGLPVL